MNRRQSMTNGYQAPPGMKLVPASYQQEPIPMMTGPIKPFQSIPMTSQYHAPSIINSNSFKNNRVAPPPPDSNSYSRTNDPFGAPMSAKSTKPFVHTTQMYSKRQLGMDTVTPNHSYYPQNNYADDIHPNDDSGENGKQTSWLRKPLCLGLTRLSGGILFGAMILLGAASIAGLATSVALYVNAITTDPQWKILGMVVSAIMLLTVLVTLCIFIYCYKQGRIVNNDNENSSSTPQYNRGDNPNQPYNYNHPYDRSPIPYGRIQNGGSPVSMNDDVIQVRDKQTNTEATNSPLRPRDFQRGVWPAVNVYGGVSHRPSPPPRMVTHFVQAFPADIDQSALQRKPQLTNMPQKTVIQRPTARNEYVEEHQPAARHEYVGGQRPRYYNEPQPQYEVVEEIIKRPRRRLVEEEYIEAIELPKTVVNKPKYNKVSVTHIKTIEQPDIVEDNLNTDHFYQ